MSKTEKSYEYLLLAPYLTAKGAAFAPTGAVQCAHLAARAAVSGDAAAHAMYAKASLEALKAFAKTAGYTLDVCAADVVGMAVVSESRYPMSPEDRYMERLIAAGRAKQIAVAKPKASAVKAVAAPAAPVQAVGLPADFSAQLAAMVAAAVKAALA